MCIVLQQDEIGAIGSSHICLVHFFQDEESALEFINAQESPLHWHLWIKVGLTEREVLNRWWGEMEKKVQRQQ